MIGPFLYHFYLFYITENALSNRYSGIIMCNKYENKGRFRFKPIREFIYIIATSQSDYLNLAYRLPVRSKINFLITLRFF